MDRNYGEKHFVLRRPEVSHFVGIIKIAIANNLCTPNNSLKNYLKCIKTQFLSVFSNITKIANFWCKNTDVSRTYRACHVIHTFFGCSLDEV